MGRRSTNSNLASIVQVIKFDEPEVNPLKSPPGPAAVRYCCFRYIHILISKTPGNQALLFSTLCMLACPEAPCAVLAWPCFVLHSLPYSAVVQARVGEAEAEAFQMLNGQRCCNQRRSRLP